MRTCDLMYLPHRCGFDAASVTGAANDAAVEADDAVITASYLLHFQ